MKQPKEAPSIQSFKADIIRRMKREKADYNRRLAGPLRWRLLEKGGAIIAIVVWSTIALMVGSKLNHLADAAGFGQ
jgi:hypothetical protein